jgi:hypothetical protein
MSVNGIFEVCRRQVEHVRGKIINRLNWIGVEWSGKKKTRYTHQGQLKMGKKKRKDGRRRRTA